MYIINGNSLRNNQRDQMNRIQRHHLKQKYGENWERGVEKDPTVTRDPEYAKRRRAEMIVENGKKYRDCAVESVEELAHKKVIDGRQADKLVRIAHDQ